MKLNLSNDQDKSSSSSSNIHKNDNNDNNDNNNKNYNKGLFILMTVPIAWGTFEPAVRFVYKYQPLMPPLSLIHI